MSPATLTSFTKTELFVIDKLSAPQILTASQLCALYQKKFPSSPKQSIYKALASLKKSETVTGNKLGYSLSLPWLERLEQFIRKAKDIPNEIISLEEKESLIYTFPNFEVADLFLAHIHHTLEPILDRKVPTCFHNPHQWFFVVREQQESATWKHMTDHGFLCLMSVSGSSEIDTYIGKNLYSVDPLLKFSRCKPLVKNTTYTAILGEFIYTVIIEPWRAKDIEQWFATNKEITENSRMKLDEIIKKRGKIKIKILCDSKKAIAWRKKIGKYFLIPKGYRLE